MTRVTIDAVLADENLRASWSATRKRSQFAVLDEDGHEVDGDAEALEAALTIPVAGLAELLADVVDLGHVGGGYGHHYDITANTVRAIQIEGREVFGHDIHTRVLQRAFVGVVGPYVEAQLHPSLFSFRPQRDRIAALLGVRRLIRRKHFHACKVDVRKFFPSVRIDQICEALRRLVPQVDEQLLRLATWFCTADIARQGPEFSAPLFALYQGAVVAPMLSNVVGAVMLDDPFHRVMGGRVGYFRYADDIFLIGADPRTVTHARDVVADLIEEAGWEVHPEKTMGCAVDLRETWVDWLGKRVTASGVITSADALADRVGAVLGAEPRSPELHRAAVALVQDLVLDPRSVVDGVVDLLRAESRPHAKAVTAQVAHFMPWRRKTMRRADSILSSLPMTTSTRC
ncbi:MAG: reverse transcriptase domain-containing protein [Sandaracinaceae bacterium]